MIHVPDVRAAVDWYTSIGFGVRSTHEEDGHMDWAAVTFGGGEVMFREAGAPSGAFRREVDLYVVTTDVDGIYERLRARVDVVEPPHDTFYGMRELIIRDLNRFWITFAQPAG